MSRTETGKRWTLIAAIVASSMAFIDATVVNVALPAIQRDLHASLADAQWVVEAYALFLSSLLLVGGSAGDRYGRRRVFVAGVALFGAASAACALAQTAPQLIGARAVQGVGGALLVPGSLALISATFDDAERGRAIGTWSAFSGITTALGPVLGGWLVDHGSWPWAFLVNLPLAAAVLAIAALRVPESRGRGAEAELDAPGALLATLGLGALVYALIEGPPRQWRGGGVVAAFALGVAALAGFVAVEAKSRAPMLPLGLFRNAAFAGTNLLTLLLYAALGGALFFFPLNLIQVQGYSAAQAGAALLPFIVILSALSRWAGKWVDRVGPRLPLVVGPVVAGAGFALFALPGVGGSYAAAWLPAVAVLGVGMGITVAPLTTTVMNAIEADLAGVASGINNAVARTAGLLAIALFGIVMVGVFEARLAPGLEAAGLPAAAVAELGAQSARLAAVELPAGLAAAEAEAARQAVGAAFVAGFRAVMLLAALLALASAAIAALALRGVPPPGRGG